MVVAAVAAVVVVVDDDDDDDDNITAAAAPAICAPPARASSTPLGLRGDGQHVDGSHDAETAGVVAWLKECERVARVLTLRQVRIVRPDRRLRDDR